MLYRLSYVSRVLHYDMNSIRFKVHSMERETGIEPASLAWKARVLPLNYSRAALPIQLAIQLTSQLTLNDLATQNNLSANSLIVFALR